MSGNDDDIAIVGTGTVATAIGILCARAGLRVQAVGGRDETKARQAAQRISSETRGGDIISAAGAARHVVIAVSDGQIGLVCDQISLAHGFRKDAVVIHMSGALNSDVLQAAKDGGGCAVGSMHPLQTLPDVHLALEKISGSYAFYEGDEKAKEFILRLAASLGMHPVEIDKSKKALYHASAVMVCNYLVSLIDMAKKMAALSGVEEGLFWQAFSPIIKATLTNVALKGTEGALTGPIARGDKETIVRHCEAVDSFCPEIEAPYKALGKITAALALRKGSIKNDDYLKILELMGDGGEPSCGK